MNEPGGKISDLAHASGREAVEALLGEWRIFLASLTSAGATIVPASRALSHFARSLTLETIAPAAPAPGLSRFPEIYLASWKMMPSV